MMTAPLLFRVAFAVAGMEAFAVAGMEAVGADCHLASEFLAVAS